MNAAEHIADLLAEKDSPPAMARRAAFGDFSPEVKAWLSDALRRHVVNGTDVKVALRLDRASRMRARNEALLRAASLLALGSDDAWPVAIRLAKAVALHRRKRGAPSTPLEDAVAAAFAAGVSVPESDVQFYNLIREA